MNIHEHQAKELLGRYGIPVPRGKACTSVGEAVAAAATASSTLIAAWPAGTGTPNFASSSLAWYSWMFIARAGLSRQ